MKIGKQLLNMKVRDVSSLRIDPTSSFKKVEKHVDHGLGVKKIRLF